MPAFDKLAAVVLAGMLTIRSRPTVTGSFTSPIVQERIDALRAAPSDRGAKPPGKVAVCSAGVVDVRLGRVDVPVGSEILLRQALDGDQCRPTR